MNLATFLGEVRHYWRLFTVVIAACAALAVAASVATPTQYTSTTRLLVTMSGSGTASAYENDDVVSGRVNSYTALVTSDAVAQRVVDTLGLNEPASEVAAKVNAAIVPPRTMLIDVAVSDTSPDQARLLADTVAREFISYTDALETPTGADGQKVHTTVVSAANDPHERLPGPWTFGALGLLAGVVLASTAVWVRSRTDGIVRTPERGAEATGLPMVGSVVATPTNASEREGYLRLRARLNLSKNQSEVTADGSRVWMIASATGEAATDTVATNLGWALARGGSRTIVVQTRPMVDSRSGTLGLSDVLRGAVPTDRAIRTAAEDLPDTLPIGIANEDMDELLASSGMVQVLADLRAAYSDVVIDAGAARRAPTAAALSEHTDGVLIVVVPGTTVRRELTEAVDRLRAVDAPLVGILVCTGTDSDAKESTGPAQSFAPEPPMSRSE